LFYFFVSNVVVVPWCCLVSLKFFIGQGNLNFEGNRNQTTLFPFF
jgi:hypothetical protein